MAKITTTGMGDVIDDFDKLLGESENRVRKILRPDNNLRDVVNRLGDNYSIRVIDGENVGYRATGNGYEIEICGLDNNKSRPKAAVFVWRISPREIVRRRLNLTSVREVLHAVRVIEELIPQPQALEEE